jgi:hypothetical protein
MEAKVWHALAQLAIFCQIGPGVHQPYRQCGQGFAGSTPGKGFVFTEGAVVMKRLELVAALCIALATDWGGPAFGQAQPPCPDSFEGATAKQLSACINSLQSSIAELKGKPTFSVLAAGFVDPANVTVSQSGPVKVAAKKVPGATGSYQMSYLAVQPKTPIVLVGPKTEELANVALTSSNETEFGVTTRNKDGVAWMGFWFLVFSHD